MLKRITPKVKDIEVTGAFLAERRKLYPQFLEQLCVLHPELEMFSLSYYADVGDGRLYAPYVRFVRCSGMIEKIVRLPLAEQKRIFHEGIEVLVGNESVNMQFYDVTPKIHRQIWDGFHLRTIDEQAHWRDRPIKPRLKLSKSRYNINSKANCVRIGNVTLYKADVMEIAKQVLDVDDLMVLIKEVSGFSHQRKKAA